MMEIIEIVVRSAIFFGVGFAIGHYAFQIFYWIYKKYWE